jgi:hypothetical protein
MKFYDRIIAAANEGVVTAAHFAPFVGVENWLLVDAKDLPKTGDPEADQCDGLCAFKVRRIFWQQNFVEIVLTDLGDIAMHLPADELAIRMEAA